jgi:hypothetical protein
VQIVGTLSEQPLLPGIRLENPPCVNGNHFLDIFAFFFRDLCSEYLKRRHKPWLLLFPNKIMGACIF